MKITLKLKSIHDVKRIEEICAQLRQIKEYDSLEVCLSSEYDKAIN
jgi:hypothetical protein